MAAPVTICDVGPCTIPSANCVALPVMWLTNVAQVTNSTTFVYPPIHESEIASLDF